MLSSQRQYDVKILSIKNTREISVRFTHWEKPYQDLKNLLEEHYSQMVNGISSNFVRSLKKDEIVCVQKKGGCFRAKVIQGVDRTSNGKISNGPCYLSPDGNYYYNQQNDVIESNDQIIVRLVDTGEVACVDSVDIRHCPNKFLTAHAFSFLCHLDKLKGIGSLISEEKLEEVVKHLPMNKVVSLRREDGPIMMKYKDFGVEYNFYSLPVDLTWTKNNNSDPFFPNILSYKSLTELFQMSIGLNKNGYLDNTYELIAEDDIPTVEEEKEFKDIQPMEESSTFQWLPPELPEKSSFSARGIFVDQSGQIYVQLNSNRQTVGALKRLMNEKFFDSDPDVNQGRMREGQECCVKWRNDGWYRGRFLCYNDDKKTEANVFLVDYGNIHVANVVTDIRRDIYAERVPIMALRVELAGVTPTGPGDTWTPECLDIIQECISYEGPDKHKKQKLKIKIVDSFGKQPLLVNIYFEEPETKKTVGLAKFLSYQGEVKLKSNFFPSPEFQDIRQKMDFGIKAVPSGTYKEKNFFVLIQEQSEGDFMDSRLGFTDISFIDWNASGLSPGSKLYCEVVEISNSNTLYLHPSDASNKYLTELTDKYDEVFAEVQAECEKAAPVFAPSIGLLVCVKYEQDGWHRAIILNYTDTTITIKFLDYGNVHTVADSLQVREMPEKFASLPVISIKLDLSIVPLENEDILHTLMTETVSSHEEMVVLEIQELGTRGSVLGCLYGKDKKLLYEGLIREGLLREIKS